MADSGAPTSMKIEMKDQAIVARPCVKMMNDDELKLLAQSIDQAAAEDPGKPLVVIDLSDVEILPSLALGLLVQIAGKCRTRQQKLKLASVRPQIRQVFAITRLDRVFDFAPSVDAALE